MDKYRSASKSGRMDESFLGFRLIGIIHNFIDSSSPIVRSIVPRIRLAKRPENFLLIRGKHA